MSGTHASKGTEGMMCEACQEPMPCTTEHIGVLYAVPGLLPSNYLAGK